MENIIAELIRGAIFESKGALVENVDLIEEVKNGKFTIRLNDGSTFDVLVGGRQE